MGEIRKVKAVSPSPFYDGKYHPPKLSSIAAMVINSKVKTNFKKSTANPPNLCTVHKRVAAVGCFGFTQRRDGAPKV